MMRRGKIDAGPSTSVWTTLLREQM